MIKNTIYIVIIFALTLFSCEEGGLLIQTDISNANVVLLAPSNDVAIATNAVNFNWSQVEDATSYEIQVAIPNFENTQQLVLVQEDSLISAVLEVTPGDYQWRVKAINSGYETGYSTASFSIIPVENFMGNTVLLNSPINNLITNDVNQTLDWQEVDGATQYRIQILEEATVLEEQVTQETNLDVMFTEGARTWSVSAENATEATGYSERNILIDITNPNTPMGTIPENDAVVTNNIVSFEWSREIVEGSIEFDIISIYEDMGLTIPVLEQQATSPFETSLEDATYYWVVKSFDEAGNESLMSPIYSFIVME